MKEKDLKSAENIRNNLNGLLDNKSAVDFCVLLFEISQLFDDIYDEGKLEKTETVELMLKTLIYLPENQFYRYNQMQLQPMINSYILQWMSANGLEDKKIMLEKSYMLRAFLFQIYHFCAKLLYGDLYAIDNAILFQELYGETYLEYNKEF